MFKKLTLGGVGILLLVSPALVFAAVSIPCRNNDVGCTTAQLVQAADSTDLGLTVAQRIELMQDAIKGLLYEINQLKFRETSNTTSSCLTLSQDMYIGKTDNTTNGQVTKLQQFLILAGLLNTQVTGYYGPLTAQAVVRWQKGHGMDFVTTRSGVGPMTRAKMTCVSAGVPVITKVEWRIEPANPSATDSYKKDEQAIFVDIIRSDNSIRGYSVGKAYGCAASSNLPAVPGKKVLGFVNCYYALSGVAFTAYETNGKFIVERGDESAMDGSVKKTVVLELPVQSGDLAAPSAQPTTVKFNWKEDNVYMVRVGQALKIPKDAYTDDEYTIYLTSIVGDTASVTITPQKNQKQEMTIRQNEAGNFFRCPAFRVTPLAITSDSVKLSVRLIPCGL